MRHKPFETWILEHPLLNQKEKKQLTEHLADCRQCRLLQANWLTTEKLIKNAPSLSPAPGFSQRWQLTLEKRLEQQKASRVRRTLLALLVLMMAGSMAYIIQNHLLITWLVVVLNVFSSAIVAVTKGLAGIGALLVEAPVVAFSIGFLFFGFATAFLMSAVFTLWQVLKKEQMVNAAITKE